MVEKKIDELPEEIILLLTQAKEVRLNAQAPYSHFLVGSCVLSESGEYSIGCNVETASYTDTTHAEQAAVSGMIAQHGSFRIKMIAIAGGKAGSEPYYAPCWPCGHCRQIIWENSNGNKDVKIFTWINKGLVAIATIGELLPYPFGPLDLGINIGLEKCTCAKN